MSIKHIFSCLLLAISLPALADEYPFEFKLLGPAFSHHSNRDDATYKSETAHVSCRPYTTEELIQLNKDRGYIGFAGGIPDKCTHPDLPKRKWNEANAAIGLEVSQRDAKGRYPAFANIVRDSYFQPGLMLGAGRAWDLASGESFEIEWGISAGLWNRHVKTGMDYPTREICTERLGQITCWVSKYTWGEKVAVTKRRWVPFVLPFIAVTHRNSGIGLNVSVVPKLGKHNTSTTAIAQLTYTF